MMIKYYDGKKRYIYKSKSINRYQDLFEKVFSVHNKKNFFNRDSKVMIFAIKGWQYSSKIFSSFFSNVKIFEQSHLVCIKNSTVRTKSNTLPISGLVFKKKLFSKEKVIVTNNVVNEEYLYFRKNYLSSDIYLTAFKDCFFYTNINFIFEPKSNNIYTDNTNYNDFVFPEEVDRRKISTLVSERKMDSRFCKSKSLMLDNVFYINSRLDVNYSHWLIESFPKIVLYYSKRENFKVPLIVSSNLHKNCLALIRSFNAEIKIIIASPYLKIISKKIYHITPVADIPFNYRSNDSLIRNHFKVNTFTQKPFLKTREALLKNKEMLSFKNKYSDSCIYLCRNSNYRLIINELDIIKINRKHGLKIIDPASLSIVEQIAMFYFCKTIITPSGSAMANLIFSGPNLNLVYIASNNKSHGYHFYPRLASVANPSIKIYQFLGEITQGVHSSYSVDIEEYEQFLVNNSLL